MNISYLMWIEQLDTPVIRSQVMDVLKTVNRIDDNTKIYILSFQHLHRVIFDFKKLSQIKNELRKNNIVLIIVPVLTIPKVFDWFYVEWFIIPLVVLQSYFAIIVFSIMKKIDIYHCRSYPITLSALLAKNITGKKVLFDPRSPFPEEFALVKNKKKFSLSLKIWKILEKFYLNNADRVVMTTKNSAIKYNLNNKSDKIKIIPNNVDLERFVSDEYFRNEFRRSYKIEENEILFCYSGTLDRHVNKSSIYARFLKNMRGIKYKHRFLFLTADIKQLQKELEKENICKDEYIAISSRYEDLPKYLSVGDFGLNLLTRYDARLSIKTVEYLSMGLPVITNVFAEGIKEMVTIYELGIVIAVSDQISDEEMEHLIKNKNEMSIRCKKYAKLLFLTEVVAEKYLNLYYEIMKN